MFAIVTFWVGSFLESDVFSLVRSLVIELYVDCCKALDLGNGQEYCVGPRKLRPGRLAGTIFCHGD